MTTSPIRPAYSTWPLYNSRLRDAVAGMTEEQLAIQPTPGRQIAIYNPTLDAPGAPLAARIVDLLASAFT